MDYRIEYVGQLKNDDGEELYGRIWLTGGVVRLATNVCEARQKESLLHEICHGVDEDQNTHLSERQVRQLSKGLYNVMVKNPDVMKWMVK